MVFYLNKIGDYQVYTFILDVIFANFIDRRIIHNAG